MRGPSWKRFELHPTYVREVDNGQYKLFGVPCSTEVMAAYERLHLGIRVQENGDRIAAWVVITSLARGDTDLGGRFFDALETLGWSPPGP
jgi:hypothetical protein